MDDKPFLAAALLCEKILEQKDDVLTVVRIVDTFTVTIPPNLPQDTKPAIQLTALLSFKKASPRAEAEKHEVRMKLRSPSGKINPVGRREFSFKPDDLSGVSLILNITLGVSDYGLFWLEISVDDDEIVTSIPFKLLEAVSPSETIR